MPMYHIYVTTWHSQSLYLNPLQRFLLSFSVGRADEGTEMLILFQICFGYICALVALFCKQTLFLASIVDRCSYVRYLMLDRTFPITGQYGGRSRHVISPCRYSPSMARLAENF